MLIDHMPQDPFILTRIIATVGPASASVERLARLIEAGARVFRINFSHGTFADFTRFRDAIRAAAAQCGIEVGILGDLCGPKIRIEQVVEGGVELAPGDAVRFVATEEVGGTRDADGAVRLSTTYPALVEEVEPGQRLLINDGAVRLLAVQREAGALLCRVTIGGLVTSRKGLNLPETQLRVESITAYDWQCVDWALEHEVDYLALSFVRQAQEVARLKAYLKKRTTPGQRIPLIAKIEKPQAVRDLDGIIEEANSVMVARGDLGVEMDLALVPIIQKQIISAAHDQGKVVIVATQMLQSMIDAPMPTRAEVSDVANAIFEGADCVMLSGETAVGDYPEEAVLMMARVAGAMRQHVGEHHPTWGQPPGPNARFRQQRYRTSALAHGVTTVTRELNARFIVVWSQHGGGARYLSMNRPTIPVLAFSDDVRALRRMNCLFAVQPLLMELPRDPEDFIARVDVLLQKHNWAEPGDPLVVVCGQPLGAVGVTNTLRIHYVGDVCRLT